MRLQLGRIYHQLIGLAAFAAAPRTILLTHRAGSNGCKRFVMIDATYLKAHRTAATQPLLTIVPHAEFYEQDAGYTQDSLIEPEDDGYRKADG